jgi:carbon monoxide dehydrogenase subunit G
MATYRARITSPRPPAEVFDYMAHFSNAAEWDPGVTEATEDGPGAAGLGSTYSLVVRVFGRAVPLRYRIDAFDRPHRVVLSAENSMVRSTDVIEVVPEDGGGSALTYDATLGLKGGAALFTPFLGRSFRRIGDRAIVGLRAALAA